MRCLFAPSILSCDHSDFKSAIQGLIAAQPDWIHFDIMDGQFVPPITFGAELIAAVRPLGSTNFEAHLMTNTPDRHFEAFAEAGCQRIIFHAEATANSHRLVQTLHQLKVQAGVAINPGTPWQAVEPLLESADLILVMTVNPGWGGQQFLHSCLEKVRAIREQNKEIAIEVDGGIAPDTIGAAKRAGADTFVTGSFLTKAESFEKGLAELRSACEG